MKKINEITKRGFIYDQGLAAYHYEIENLRYADSMWSELTLMCSEGQKLCIDIEDVDRYIEILKEFKNAYENFKKECATKEKDSEVPF